MKVVYLSNKLNGQALSYDFLIACAIFLFVISLLAAQLGYTTKELNEIRGENELIGGAYKLSGFFFDEGYPKNWNSTNVKIIGLQTDNRIDWNKLKSLNEMGYQKSLILFGLKNDYNITIFRGNSPVNSFGKSHENASSVVKIDRVGILNNSVVSVRVLVFEYE